MAVFRQGTHPVWAAFATVYFCALFVASIYWLFTETGPVRWLADQQASVLGGWYPKLTAVVVLIVGMLPALVIKFAIEGITGVKLVPPRDR